MTGGQLLLLRRAYLACRPLAELKKILNSLEGSNIPSEHDFVSVVLQNVVSQRYPPHREYRLSVAKLLISFVESYTELGDFLYDVLASILAEPSSESNFASYEIGCKNDLECITLIENRALVSGGTTGLRSWPAAKILAEVLLNEKLGGRRILELGSGVGLTGLVLLKKCPDIASYTFTDCHSAVLEKLKMNLQLNFDPPNPKANVQLLDWCVGGAVEADLLVGADIVFDKDVVPALAKLIVDAVEHHSCDVIISNVIRSEDTYRAFYASVSEKLECEKIQVNNLRYFEDIPDKYEVLKLRKKHYSL